MSAGSIVSELGKIAAAERALLFVKPRMVLGLGTGSTASWFVKLLSEKIISNGLEVLCVATSKSTFDQAKSLKIPLTTLDDKNVIDMVIDGADEFDLNLNLIKGGGGALLQEKIVAAAAKRVIIITDSSKESGFLGGFDLPVEIVQFGSRATMSIISETLRDIGFMDFKVQFRKDSNNENFVTDEGHFILDLRLKVIREPKLLHENLIRIPGVVETGLFLGVATTIVVGESDGHCKIIGA